MSRLRRLGLAVTAALLCTSVAAATLEAKPKKKGHRTNPQALAGQFDLVTLAEGFEQPSGLSFLPDGSLLVTEKDGKLWLVESGGSRKLLLDLSAQVVTQRERGLNGVAAASDFATSRRVYLLYAYKSNPGNPEGPQAMRLTHITLNPDNTLANPAAPETVILGKDATRACPPRSKRRDCPPSVDATHQGGTVISAPDGTLWVGLGDSNLPSNPGLQTFRTYDDDSTAGKILHIDSEGRGLPSHPFCRKVDDLDRTCTKIFATGFRNPFRFSLTPSGTPIVGDVGWNLKEEIDLVKRGRNYGWPCMEGKVRTPFYSDLGPCKQLYRRGKREFSPPVHQYKNPVKGFGAAVIVGPHYDSGPYPPSFNNSYLIGDYAQGHIARLKIRKGKVRTRKLVRGVGPVDFALAPDGNLVFADYVSGGVRKLVFSPSNKAPIARIAASPTSGPGPLAVGFSALNSTDPDGNALTYQWDFDGDGNVDSFNATDSFTYALDGTYTARLTVSDGTTTATATTTIVVGNTFPTAAITTPSGTLSRGGQPVTLAASAADADGDGLSYSWHVVLFHKEHQHPLGTFTGNPTQFTAVNDHDADSHYEATVIVTDSGGLSTHAGPVTIVPETVPLRIVSRPRGVVVSYGGRKVKAPKKIEAAAIGFAANLSAPAEIEKGGKTWHFAGWKHGGKRNQIYTIPAGASKVVARYKNKKSK